MGREEEHFLSMFHPTNKLIIDIKTMFNSVGSASHSFKLLDVEHLPNPLDVGVLPLDLLDW